MFYNGFNMMIDIILVTATALYVRWMTRREIVQDMFHELDYEYNEGYNAGYNYASALNLTDKRNQ